MASGFLVYGRKIQQQYFMLIIRISNSKFILEINKLQLIYGID